MKRLYLLALLMLTAIFAQAAGTYITPSQIAPHFNPTRKAPCGSGAGDSCGSNPPTWHLTPDQCGAFLSTGAAKNGDGTTNSSEGIRYTLPTAAEFVTAGYNASGAPGNTGITNREGWCIFTFTNGNPGPNNYIRIGLDGIAGTDKFTTFAQSAYDVSKGDPIIVPFTTSGSVSVLWNGNSWISFAGSPNMLEHFGGGQLNAHGQARLFKVTADPSWWSAGTRVGALAYCPNNGRGTIGVGALGGYHLTLMPQYCTYLDNDLSAGADWVTMRNITSGQITAIAQGAAYGSGTAPNGVAYSAGNYIVIQPTTKVSYVTGDTVEIHNVYTNNGSVMEGRWIGKSLTAGVDTGCPAATNCIELHEKVDIANGIGASVNIGPPSSFVASDSLVSGASYNYSALVAVGTGSAKTTNTLNGTDIVAAANNTVIGLAVKNVTNGYEDSATKRGVASLFFPMDKECKSTFSTDRTTTSTTSTEINSEIRCTFAYIQGTVQNNTTMGDPGRGVRWAIHATVSNNTNGDGCSITANFDGGTDETQVVQFTNVAGANGGKVPMTVSGVKNGLTAGSHFVTLKGQAITGGTCTFYSAGTNVILSIPQ